MQHKDAVYINTRKLNNGLQSVGAACGEKGD